MYQHLRMIRLICVVHRSSISLAVSTLVLLVGGDGNRGGQVGWLSSTLVSSFLLGKLSKFAKWSDVWHEVHIIPCFVFQAVFLPNFYELSKVHLSVYCGVRILYWIHVLRWCKTRIPGYQYPKPNPMFSTDSASARLAVVWLNLDPWNESC